LNKPVELKRQIGLGTATALIVGEVIAVGIFLTPAGMAKSLGSPVWLLIVWLLMGGMALCGALCYGELAARFPEAGGGYVYLREAYGRPIAFLYGWMALLVMDPGLTALLAVGLASYVGYIFGLSSSGLKAVAIGSILFVALVNMRGVRLGGWMIRWLTILKLGLLAFVIIWGFGLRAGHWSNFTPLVAQRPGSEALLGALAGGIVAVLMLGDGGLKSAVNIREPLTKDVAEADQNRQPDATQLQVIDQLLEIDCPLRIFRGVHAYVPIGPDRKVALAPAIDLVEFRRVRDGPGIALAPRARYTARRAHSGQ